MGLAFKGSKAQWSYGGFMDFRKRAWTACGFPGNLRDIYYHKSDINLDIAKEHPLYDFFNHSDADGELTAEQLVVITPALKDVYAKLRENTYPFDHDVEALGHLIETCEQCVEKNKPLIFS